MHKILITKEVARLLRLSEGFVRKLIRDKKLMAYREGNRGGYRILERDVSKYIKAKLSKNL